MPSSSRSKSSKSSIISDSSDSSGCRRALNDILDSKVQGCIKPAFLNSVGTCGETPAHISIYRSDKTMLQLCLSSGFNVNLRNSKGETICHVCAMLGDLNSLRMICETGLCDLYLKDAVGSTALDIARAPFRSEDIMVMRLFRNWSQRDAETNEMRILAVVRGRKECIAFLEQKLAADEQTRNLRVADQVEVLNKERRRIARMCRGIGPTNFVEYSSTLELPSAAPKTAGERDRVKSQVTEWSERDERFFESGWGLEVAKRKLMVNVFVFELVDSAVRVGFDRAQRVIRQSPSS